MSVTPGIRRYGKADADSVGRKTPGSAVMNRRKQILSTPLSSARKEATPNRFHLSKTDPAAAAVRNILFEEEEDEDDANTSWSSVDSQVSRHGHACASFLRSALHYYYHTLQGHSFFFLPVLTAFFFFLFIICSTLVLLAARLPCTCSFPPIHHRALCIVQTCQLCEIFWGRNGNIGRQCNT